jgi:hypothetical protein
MTRCILVLVSMVIAGCALDVEYSPSEDDLEAVAEFEQEVAIDDWNTVCWSKLGVYQDGPADPYWEFQLSYGHKVHAYYPVINGRVNVSVLTGYFAGARGWVDKDGVSQSCP